MPSRVTYERGAETGCTLTPPGEYDRAVICAAAMPAVASHLYCCSNLLLLVGGSDRGWLTWYARVLYGEVEFEVLVARLHVHEDHGFQSCSSHGWASRGRCTPYTQRYSQGAAHGDAASRCHRCDNFLSSVSGVRLTMQGWGAMSIAC